MYQYEPISDRKKAKVLLLVFALFGLLSLMIGIIGKSYAGIFDCVAILFFSLDVLFFNRYVKKRIIYTIKENGTDYDLAIYEVQNKDSLCTFRMPLSKLSKISKKGEGKIPNGKKYNYCIDIGENNYSILEFTDNNEKILVFLTPDEKMNEMFSTYGNIVE